MFLFMLILLDKPLGFLSASNLLPSSWVTAVFAGPEDLRSFLSPFKYWGDIKESEQGLGVNIISSKNVSDSIPTDASKFSTMSESGCHSCSVSRRGKHKVDDVKDNDKSVGMNSGAKKDYVEKEINDASSLEGNIGLPGEPSTSSVGKSSEKMGHAEISGTCNEQRLRRSKTKESASLKSPSTRNDALTDSLDLRANKNTFNVSLSKLEINPGCVSSLRNFGNRRKKELPKGSRGLTGGKLNWNSFEASPSQSTVGLLRNPSGNSGEKEKEPETLILGLKSAKRWKKSLPMVSDMTSNTLQNDTFVSCGILNPQKDGFSVQECGTVGDDSIKLAQDSGKLTQISLANENLNKSVRSSDECYDVNRSHKLETRVGGGKTCSQESSCKEKAKRRLCFNAHVSCLQCCNVCISCFHGLIGYYLNL